jgi:phosphomannomutase
MIKAKVERGESSWAQVEQRLRARFADWESDTADGLRLSRGEEWLHVRASGTEPVVRFIAETLDAERTRNLIEEARAALAPARAGSV